MLSQEEMRQKLFRAYELTMEQKPEITSWPKFASFIDIPYPTIYRLVNEKANVTHKMLRRIYSELSIRGIKIEDKDIFSVDVLRMEAEIEDVSSDMDKNPEMNHPSNSELLTEHSQQVNRLITLLEEKDKQINRLLSIIEKMQNK